VTSEEGKGSTFTVSVKRGRGHLPGDRVHVSSPPGPMLGSDAYVQEATRWSSESTGGSSWPSSQVSSGVSALVATTIAKRRPRIVLADDNADMREYVERLLSEQYDVLPVPNGARALDIVLTDPPDLVLTDVMMPEMDGFALLTEIRRNPKTRTIPVIVLSARAGEEAAVQGLAAGADDYLAKPFSARELLARVRTHLELARVRREVATELEQANSELEAFSHSVSHDLRAPLRAIDGFSRIVLAKHAQGLDAEGARYLERIRAATTRMSHLIDDLIDLSRVSRAPVKRERIELSKIAKEVSDEASRRDPARSVAVEVAPDMIARGDARLLAVVFENLIGNAFKFTERKPDARIRVGSLTLGRETAYFVKDDGAGFDMAYADKLFRPFSRLHRSDEFDGTGIGLATVQRVISRHGGRVWAEGALGEGAAFYFTLSEMA
jgi:signal transduction histidine kinase